MKGYAIMKGGLTEQGALKILYKNELIILNVFRDALHTQLTDQERELVTTIYEKQKRFVRFLELQTSQCSVKEGFGATQ